MKTLQRGFSGVLFGGLLAFAGHAADSTPTQAQLDARARLAKICDACGIVESVTIQTTKGEGGLAGKIGGAVLGGVLGHQIGGGGGRDLATAGGVVAGAVIGSNAGRDNGGYERNVQRCETTASGPPQYWDVSYDYRGTTHQVQMASEPGRTIAVNSRGEPRQ